MIYLGYRGKGQLMSFLFHIRSHLTDKTSSMDEKIKVSVLKMHSLSTLIISALEKYEMVLNCIPTLFFKGEE